MDQYRDLRHIVLLSVNDTCCVWHLLKGHQLVLHNILNEVKEHYYQFHIDKNASSFKICRQIAFPTPTDLSINMMPIYLHKPKASLPDFAQQYLPLIYACPTTFSSFWNETYIEASRNWKDEIGYLTIQEGWIEAGQTQRRPGVHIERPARNVVNGYVVPIDNEDLYRNLAFGLGHSRNDNVQVDGIYMASNVADSCQVYPVQIDKPLLCTDPHGGLAHMKTHLGKSTDLKANQLIWMTDRTPHEALPAKTRAYRQFFRLVAGPISVWHSQHNTPNPLGVLPDAAVCHDSKFQASPAVLDSI